MFIYVSYTAGLRPHIPPSPDLFLYVNRSQGSTEDFKEPAPRLTVLATLTSLHCKDTTQKILKQIFSETELCDLSPNFHIHVSVSELFIPRTGLPMLLQEIANKHMNVEDVIEAAQFLFWENINGIFVAI